MSTDAPCLRRADVTLRTGAVMSNPTSRSSLTGSRRWVWLIVALGCSPPSQHPCPGDGPYYNDGVEVSDPAECAEDSCILNCDGTDACFIGGLWCEDCEAVDAWLAGCPGCVVTHSEEGVIFPYCEGRLSF